MLKATTLGTLILCTTLFLKGSCTLEKAAIIQNLVIGLPQSTTVPFNGHLYTVSKNQSHIHINSTDTNYQCDIAIDASKDVTQGRLEVTSTEQEIFIVGVQSIAPNDVYNYTVLRIDPVSCSYNSASIPETNDRRGSYFLPRLVRHRKGTDVFFPSLKTCAPCRLNNVGLRSKETAPQLPRETSPPGVPFHMRYVEARNSYFYVYNIMNISASIEETSMKLLNGDDFSVTKQRTVANPIHTVARQKKSIGYLGVCSKMYDHFMADIDAFEEVRCDMLNSELLPTSSVRITIEPHSEPVSSVSYEFDDDGNSYIGFAQDTKLRLYIHDAAGKLYKAFDLGKVDERFEHFPDDPNAEDGFYDPYDHWDVRGFLVGNNYCIVTEQMQTNYPQPLHDVKCVDVQKYKKHH